MSASETGKTRQSLFFVSLLSLLFPDTTVTVSIAAVPNYAAVKTEVPGHGFSVSVPNACTETDGHVGVYERQLAHSSVQYSPSTQSRTPPDSTFTESYKDGSQEVCVCVSVCTRASPSLFACESTFSCKFLGHNTNVSRLS